MKVTRLVAIACYYSGVDALFYRLNRNAKRILTFHNVLPSHLFEPNVANGVSNSVESFRKIIDLCSERFRFSTDVLDPQTATLTFDDGYHNQYSYAFRILRERRIPAIVFVAGDVTGKQGGLLVDKLLHWVSLAPLDCIPGKDRLRYWCTGVWPAYMADGVAKGRTVLAELDRIYSYRKIEDSLSAEYRRERLEGISPEELAEMRNSGWSVGWHTWSHFPLGKLTRDEVAKELNSPPEYRNCCLSFPYGNSEEVGTEAVALAEQLGYPTAVANVNHSRLNSESRYFLPRMSLGSDKYMLHFVLSGAKFFLKFHRLLPRLRFVQ